LRTLIVDDEPLARRHIRTMLSPDAHIEIVGECGNGRDAVDAIVSQSPDLVFLDIQMPELNGFEVLAQVGAEQMPAVIFVTAHDEYALKAFDVHALDYVLKPVERDRLLLAVERAKARLANGTMRQVAVQQATNVLNTIRQFPSLDRIAIRVDGKHLFLAPSTIDWVEAVDDYVRLHVARTSYLVRGTLQSFANQLPPQFLRIHRSAVVNTERVREISSTPQGDHRLTLQDGTRLPSGRSYRGAIAEFLRTFTVE
jgi:two-component system LytT family response regulator